MSKNEKNIGANLKIKDLYDAFQEEIDLTASEDEVGELLGSTNDKLENSGDTEPLLTVFEIVNRIILEFRQKTAESLRGIESPNQSEAPQDPAIEFMEVVYDAVIQNLDARLANVSEELKAALQDHNITPERIVLSELNSTDRDSDATDQEVFMHELRDFFNEFDFTAALQEALDFFTRQIEIFTYQKLLKSESKKKGKQQLNDLIRSAVLGEEAADTQKNKEEIAEQAKAIIERLLKRGGQLRIQDIINAFRGKPEALESVLHHIFDIQEVTSVFDTTLIQSANEQMPQKPFSAYVHAIATRILATNTYLNVLLGDNPNAS